MRSYPPVHTLKGKKNHALNNDLYLLRLYCLLEVPYLDNILNKRTWRGMRLNRLMEKDTENKDSSIPFKHNRI